MKSDKVKVFPICFKKQVQTDGSTTPSYIDLKLDAALLFGPYLESIQVHTATENRTSNFQWNLVFWWSLDGRQWEGPVDLFTAITANGAVIQPAYTTTTQLGLQMRYGLAVANTSGTAIERAVVCSALVFTFKS